MPHDAPTPQTASPSLYCRAGRGRGAHRHGWGSAVPVASLSGRSPRIGRLPSHIRDYSAASRRAVASERPRVPEVCGTGDNEASSSQLGIAQLPFRRRPELSRRVVLHHLRCVSDAPDTIAQPYPTALVQRLTLPERTAVLHLRAVATVHPTIAAAPHGAATDPQRDHPYPSLCECLRTGSRGRSVYRQRPALQLRHGSTSTARRGAARSLELPRVVPREPCGGACAAVSSLARTPRPHPSAPQRAVPCRQPPNRRRRPWVGRPSTR